MFPSMMHAGRKKQNRCVSVPECSWINYVDDATVSRLHGWVDTGMAVVWIADRFKETRGVSQ